jgi:hypothetical protein
MALIFIGAVFDVKASVEDGAAGGQSAVWPGKIVTGRHNEYTIPVDVKSKARESAMQISGWEFHPYPGCLDPPNCSSKGSDRP